MIIGIWCNTNLRHNSLRFRGPIVPRRNRPTKSATRYWKRLKRVLIPSLYHRDLVSGGRSHHQFQSAKVQPETRHARMADLVAGP